MSGTRDLLWAAQIGELCGRAGDGLAPEWGFLDVWLELVGAERGCLCLGRKDGREDSFGRGLSPQVTREDKGLFVREGAAFGVEGSILQIATHSTNGARASLLCDGDDELAADLQPVLPLIERALLRLATASESPFDAAARKAWFSAAHPMLLLSADLTTLAANPAAHRRLGISPGQHLPAWLQRWLDSTLSASTTSAEAAWTVRGGDHEYNLSVLSVDPSEPTPGRWLVSIVRGGPALPARIDRATDAFGLTPREGEMLEMLAEGLSNRQIAAALDVTESTVKFHLMSVMRKAEVTSRTELLARLHRLHLVDPDGDIPPNAIRLRGGFIWQDDEGIVNCTQDEGTAMERDDVLAFREAVRSYFTGERLLVYSDATGVVSSSSEAQAEAAISVPEVAGTAIRAGSAVSRALVNLYLRINEPPEPTRLFANKESALAWLRTLPR